MSGRNKALNFYETISLRFSFERDAIEGIYRTQFTLRAHERGRFVTDTAEVGNNEKRQLK